MLILGKAVEWMMGKWMLPALVVGVLVLGGKMLEARRAALISQGVKQCESDWQLALARQERDVAFAQARAASAQAEATERLNTEIQINAADIKKELERELAAARGAIAIADQRCISDGVRDLARGVSRDGGGQPAGGSGKGPARKQ